MNGSNIKIERSRLRKLTAEAERKIKFYEEKGVPGRAEFARGRLSALKEITDPDSDLINTDRDHQKTKP